MPDINKLREEINEIDSEMCRLFERRMQAVKGIAEYKKARGLPVFDNTREKEVIERNSKKLENPDLASYYVGFLKNNMKISKNYQKRLIDGLKIAFCGTKGAFAYMAAKKIFPDAELVPFGSFEDAYRAVENGICDVTVLPIENSYHGDVVAVTDLGFFGSLYISGVYSLPIVHNLLAVQGAEIGDIKKVVSHPQALAQCGEYIKKAGLLQEETSSTAHAAKSVAENKDKTVAAIASDSAAEVYGLKILERAVNTDLGNTTRFAVFTTEKARSKTAENFIMYFTVKHEAGALSKAISILAEQGFNMKSLKSHPNKDEKFKYYFYIEAEGKFTETKESALVDALSQYCKDIKIIGIYEKEINLSGTLYGN